MRTWLVVTALGLLAACSGSPAVQGSPSSAPTSSSPSPNASSAVSTSNLPPNGVESAIQLLTSLQVPPQVTVGVPFSMYVDYNGRCGKHPQDAFTYRSDDQAKTVTIALYAWQDGSPIPSTCSDENANVPARATQTVTLAQTGTYQFSAQGLSGVELTSNVNVLPAGQPLTAWTPSPLPSQATNAAL